MLHSKGCTDRENELKDCIEELKDYEQINVS